MSDPRLTPDPKLVTQDAPAQVTQPVLDLCRTPQGPRDRQLLFGDPLRVLNTAGGWCYVQADKDGYCGFVRDDGLGPQRSATHHVCAPATHVYSKPDFKSSDRMSLSFDSRIQMLGTEGNFARTPDGFIPLVHLAKPPIAMPDPAAIAAAFLGTPYLWGGNSRWGIDCSGLVQASLLACGFPCPGDSDMQEALGEDAEGELMRNDLLFWKGHVAIVVDDQTLIHANAGAMACVYEPIDDAVRRIAQQGDGAVTAHRRLPALSGLINSPPEA